MDEADLATSRVSLSTVQRRQFVARGLLKIEKLIDPTTASQLADELWLRFTRWGIERGNPESWQQLEALSIRRVIKGTRRLRGLDAIYNASSDSIVASLAATATLEKSKPLLLLTFSGSHEHVDDEVVPSSIWHSDAPNLPGTGAAGVIALGFLNHVQARGGGTMVIAGSQRLYENTSTAVTSKMAKRRLKKHPYFRELFSKNTPHRQRFLSEPACVDGIELQVEELTGQPGDVYFVNANLLHTITRNYRIEPRMMIRGFYGTSKLNIHYQELFKSRSQRIMFEIENNP